MPEKNIESPHKINSDYFLKQLNFDKPEVILFYLVGTISGFFLKSMLDRGDLDPIISKIGLSRNPDQQE